MWGSNAEVGCPGKRDTRVAGALVSGARVAWLGYLGVVEVNVDVGAVSVVFVPVSGGASLC